MARQNNDGIMDVLGLPLLFGDEMLTILIPLAIIGAILFLAVWAKKNLSYKYYPVSMWDAGATAVDGAMSTAGLSSSTVEPIDHFLGAVYQWLDKWTASPDEAPDYPQYYGEQSVAMGMDGQNSVANYGGMN